MLPNHSDLEYCPEHHQPSHTLPCRWRVVFVRQWWMRIGKRILAIAGVTNTYKQIVTTRFLPIQCCCSTIVQTMVLQQRLRFLPIHINSDIAHERKVSVNSTCEPRRSVSAESCPPIRPLFALPYDLRLLTLQTARSIAP